ncbi:MAG: hypothetical protein QM817_31050 [Archangium sp.]
MNGFSVEAFRRFVDSDEVVVIALGDDPAAWRAKLNATEPWLASSPPHSAEIDVLFGRPTGLGELLFCRSGVIVRWWVGHSGTLSALDVKPDVEAPFTAERYRSLVAEVRGIEDIEAEWRHATAWREPVDEIPRRFTLTPTLSLAGDGGVQRLSLDGSGSATLRRGASELQGFWHLRTDGDLDLHWKRFVHDEDADHSASASDTDQREVWHVGQLGGVVQVRPSRGLLPRLTTAHRVFVTS